jgi:K+-transporting ATPase ATPase A chain
MTSFTVIQYVLYFAALTALAVPLGAYMARVYTGEARFAQKLLGPIERFFYWLSGVRASEDMSWKHYALRLLVFNLISTLFVYAIQRLQGDLLLDPAGLPAVSPQVAFNTAVSFATNTNWQAYSGETTMSQLTQMLALTVQNFVSAASGMAVAAALARGFARRSASGIGNFWTDLTKSTLYILVPLSLVVALFLVSQGVVQTFAAGEKVELLQPNIGADGHQLTEQSLALGPVASQVAIKQLGTNGKLCAPF